MKIDSSDIEQIKDVQISPDILNFRDQHYKSNLIYDISALQPASDSGWIEGVKIILDYDINNIQGSGSCIINKKKFYNYYNNYYKSGIN